MSTWYLGPLGDLRPLVCPERDVSINEVRYGGVHQGITGARRLDVTGHRAEYSFAWKWLSTDEWTWLEALHDRLVPGPFRLINPLKKNRLTVQSTNGTVTTQQNAGVSHTLSYTRERDYPTGLVVPGRSMSFTGWAGSPRIDFDPIKRTTVRPLETVTASIYLRSLAAYSVTLGLDYYDADLLLLSSQTSTANVTTAWQRFSITRTVPAGCAAVGFRLNLATATTTVRFAAPQLESGSTATAFEPGGAAPVVHIDQLSSTSPRFPFRDCSMNLLEA